MAETDNRLQKVQRCATSFLAIDIDNYISPFFMHPSTFGSDVKRIQKFFHSGMPCFPIIRLNHLSTFRLAPIWRGMQCSINEHLLHRLATYSGNGNMPASRQARISLMVVLVN